MSLAIDSFSRRFSPIRILRPFSHGRIGSYLLILIVSILWAPSHAQVEPVIVRAPTTEAWTGQQLTFYVDIRVKGSFGGATSFSIPQIPRSLVLKVGNATISSATLEGESYFVQTHKFALFSQATGTVEVPAFAVRYGQRDGYTGPVNDSEGTVPPSQFEIRRPPDTENLGFLVTTDSLTISESWDPQPSDAKAGTVFKRTVQQSAEQLSGMALAPLPQEAPEGVRVYPDEPIVEDETARGAFRGTRSETLSYFLETPGEYTLPEIQFFWWNPTRERLESKTLPSLAFTVSPSPQSVSNNSQTQSITLWKPIALLAFVLVIGFALQKPAKRALVQLREKRNSPERLATRKLLQACRANDAPAAYEAYLAHPPMKKTESFSIELRKLEQILYSKSNDTKWSGQTFAAVFKDSKKLPSAQSIEASLLPPLNPLQND